MLITDSEDKSSESGVQLNRSVTVPAPSTSLGPDVPFWNAISRLEIDNVDQINPVPLQRSKTTINVLANRNQGSGTETTRQPSPPPQTKLNRSITSAGRNPGTQQELAAPVRGLSLRGSKEPPSTPRQRSASPSTSQQFYFRLLLGHSRTFPLLYCRGLLR